MKKTLIKDLILSSGKIVKKGSEISTIADKNILQVDRLFFAELEQKGYFKKKIINT